MVTVLVVVAIWLSGRLAALLTGMAKVGSIAHMAKMTASMGPVLVMTVSVSVVGMVVVVGNIGREIAGITDIASVTVAPMTRRCSNGLATRRQARRLLLVVTLVLAVLAVLALLALVELLLMMVLLLLVV